MKKEVFVLLPGWTRSFRTYKHFFENAPREVDLHFINYQDVIPNGNVKDFPRKLLEYLNKKGIKKFSLTGFSVGGALAFVFALNYPDSIDKLYLVNGAGIYGKENVFQILKNQTANLLERRGTKMFRSIRNSNMFNTNPLLTFKLGLYAHKVDIKDKQIPKSFPETVILWGERDVVHPLWQGEEFHKLIPRSKLIIIPEGGHDWLVYSPEKFWDQISLG